MGWANAIWVGIYRYGAGAGSPAGEILNPHPHIAGAGVGAGAPVDKIWDPHPPGLKSANTRIHGCNCHP